MIVYISYAMLPFVLFSFVISGYIVGKWTEDGDILGWSMFCMFVAAAVSILVSLHIGSTTGGNAGYSIIPPNIPAMFGLNCGCISMLFVVLIVDFIKRRVDFNKSVDKKAEALLKKYKLENDIILKRNGVE